MSKRDINVMQRRRETGRWAWLLSGIQTELVEVGRRALPIAEDRLHRIGSCGWDDPLGLSVGSTGYCDGG